MDHKSALEQASERYNSGDYSGAIKSFESALAACYTDEQRKSIDVFTPLKLRCYLQLNQDQQLLNELTETLQKYQNDQTTLLSIIILLGKFEMEEVLFAVDIKSRFIYAQQNIVASRHARYEIAADTLAKFEAMPPDEFESNLSFTNKAEYKHQFTLGNLSKYKVNELPNNNIYIELHIQKDENEIIASIPGPSNDAICESGELTIKEDGIEQRCEVNRYQVSFINVWGPYQLKVETELGNLIIMNTQLAAKS